MRRKAQPDYPLKEREKSKDYVYRTFEFGGRQWVGYINFLFQFCLLMFSLAHHLHCSGFQHLIQSIKFSAFFFKI